MMNEERIFVRSKYAITHDSQKATGRRSKESECIKEFGDKRWKSMLSEMDDSGSALLPPYGNNKCDGTGCQGRKDE